MKTNSDDSKQGSLVEATITTNKISTDTMIAKITETNVTESKTINCSFGQGTNSFKSWKAKI